MGDSKYQMSIPIRSPKLSSGPKKITIEFELTEKELEFIHHRFEEDMNLKQCAAVMGISHRTAKWYSSKLIQQFGLTNEPGDHFPSVVKMIRILLKQGIISMGLLFMLVNPLRAQTHSVLVSGTASSTTGVNYHIYRGGVVIASPKTPSYTDTAVTAGTSYTYQMSAFCPAVGCSGGITGESVLSGVIIVTIPGGGVTPPPPVTTVPYVLGTIPTALAFSGTTTGLNPLGQSVSVQDSTPCPPPTGVPVCHWPFTAKNSSSWLTLTPAGGTTSATFQATVKLAGLVAGTYTDTIVLTVTPQSGLVLSNSPYSIPVRLTVTGVTPPPPPPPLTLTCATNVCTIGGGVSGQTGSIQIVPGGPTATWRKP